MPEQIYITLVQEESSKQVFVDLATDTIPVPSISFSQVINNLTVDLSQTVQEISVQLGSGVSQAKFDSIDDSIKDAVDDARLYTDNKISDVGLAIASIQSTIQGIISLLNSLGSQGYTDQAISDVRGELLALIQQLQSRVAALESFAANIESTLIDEIIDRLNAYAQSVTQEINDALAGAGFATTNQLNQINDSLNSSVNQFFENAKTYTDDELLQLSLNLSSYINGEIQSIDQSFDSQISSINNNVTNLESTFNTFQVDFSNYTSRTVHSRDDAPTTANEGDLWVDTDSDEDPINRSWYEYQNGLWVLVEPFEKTLINAVKVNAAMISAGTITTDQLVVSLKNRIDKSIQEGTLYNNVSITPDQGVVVNIVKEADVKETFISIGGDSVTKAGEEFTGIAIQSRVLDFDEQDNPIYPWETKFFVSRDGDMYVKGNIRMEDGSILTGNLDQGVFIDPKYGLTVLGQNNRISIIASGTTLQPSIPSSKEDDESIPVEERLLEYSGILIERLGEQTVDLRDTDGNLTGEQSTESKYAPVFYADANGNLNIKGTLQAGSVFVGNYTKGVYLDEDLGLLVQGPNARVILNPAGSAFTNIEQTQDEGTQEWSDSNIEYNTFAIQKGSQKTQEGTITATTSSREINGSSTVFTSLSEGDIIYVTDTYLNDSQDIVEYEFELGVVDFIESDTILTLKSRPTKAFSSIPYYTKDWRMNFYVNSSGDVFARGNLQLEDGSILVGDPTSKSVFIDKNVGLVVQGTSNRIILSSSGVASGGSSFSGIAILKDPTSGGTYQPFTWDLFFHSPLPDPIQTFASITDGLGETRTDVLGVYAENSNQIQSVATNEFLSDLRGKRIKIKFSYYIPSGQPNVDGFRVRSTQHYSSQSGNWVNAFETGRWIDFESETLEPHFLSTASYSFEIGIYSSAVGGSLFTGAGEQDYIYFKDFQVIESDESETVFYANDSGDLVLKGTVFANGGLIGGVNISNESLYVGDGFYNNPNTGFYLNAQGSFSLKDKFSWNPSTNQLTIKGSIIQDSDIPVFKGDWDPNGVTYYKSDLVNYNSSIYICLVQNISNATDTPAVDTTNWGLYLESGVAGPKGDSARSVTITPSKQVIRYNQQGLENDPQITFTATPYNFDGVVTYDFSVNGTLKQAEGASNTFALLESDQPGVEESIIVSVRAYEDGVIEAIDYVTIYGLRNGSNAITLVLSNENHTLPLDTDNNNEIIYTGSGTEIRLFEGADELTYDGVGTSNGRWKVTVSSTNITPGQLTDQGSYAKIGEHSNITNPSAFVLYTVEGKTTDGSNILVQKQQTISKLSEGVAGSSGNTNRLVQAFKRSASIPSDKPSADVTVNLSTGEITSPTDGNFGNSWYSEIPDGTSPVYVVFASAFGSGTTDVISPTEWTDASLYTENGKTALTIFIYQRTETNTTPSLPIGNSTYTFDQKTLAFSNANGWSQTIPSLNQLETNSYLWVSTATAFSSGNTDIIPDTEWAAPQILSLRGTKGDTGDTGIQGPGVVYRGPFNASKIYYYTAERRDIVSVGTNYYLANEPEKSGNSTWFDPLSGQDWIGFGSQFESIATNILLAQDATILKGLVMGEEGGAGGFIRSANYNSIGDGNGSGFYLNHDGSVEFGSPNNKLSFVSGNLTIDGGTLKSKNYSTASLTTFTTNFTIGWEKNFYFSPGYKSADGNDVITNNIVGILSPEPGSSSNILKAKIPGTPFNSDAYGDDELNRSGINFLFYFADNGFEEADYAEFEYQLKFDNSWSAHLFDDGKLPGFASTNRFVSGATGWGGRKTTGDNGWSARGLFIDENSTVNTTDGIENSIAVGNYVYHIDQPENYGQNFQWNAPELDLNTWYRIKQTIKMNDPGLSNGELKCYIDGNLVFSETNFKFRNTSNIGIQSVWFNIYLGGAGTDRPFTDQFFYIREAKITSSPKFSLQGTEIDLSTGAIKSPNFSVDSVGNSYLSGDAYFSGRVSAGSLTIGENVNGTKNGIFINDDNYFYDTGDFKIGNEYTYLFSDLSSGYNIRIQSFDDLDGKKGFLINSRNPDSNTARIAFESEALTNGPGDSGINNGTGFYADDAGRVRVGKHGGNSIKFDGTDINIITPTVKISSNYSFPSISQSTDTYNPIEKNILLSKIAQSVTADNTIIESPYASVSQNIDPGVTIVEVVYRYTNVGGKWVKLSFNFTADGVTSTSYTPSYIISTSFFELRNDDRAKNDSLITQNIDTGFNYIPPGQDVFLNFKVLAPINSSFFAADIIESVKADNISLQYIDDSTVYTDISNDGFRAYMAGGRKKIEFSNSLATANLDSVSVGDWSFSVNPSTLNLELKYLTTLVETFQRP